MKKTTFWQIAFATLCLFVFPHSSFAQTTQKPVLQAQKLVELMSIKDGMMLMGNNEQHIDRSIMFMVIKIAKANPKQEEKIKSIVRNVKRKTFPIVLNDFIRYNTYLFSENFSEKELSELIHFYKKDSVRNTLRLITNLAINPRGPQPSEKAVSEIENYFKTGSGQKYQQRLANIAKKRNIYTANVMRKKERDLAYKALRQELPSHGLKLPVPFEPDTFVDHPKR